MSLGLAWLSCFSTEQIFSSSQELWTIGQPALFNSFQMALKLSDVLYSIAVTEQHIHLLLDITTFFNSAASMNPFPSLMWKECFNDLF